MTYLKHNVEVIARFRREGGLYPLRIVWEDGRVFAIERVLSQGYAPARTAGRLCVRYLCTIAGKRRALYFEEHARRWFVEIPAAPYGGK